MESKDARDGRKGRCPSSGVSAIALAEAVRQQFDADWGIGIAPFPAGTRAELSRSEARATFAIACREKPTVDFQTSLAGNPAILNVRLSKTTLLQLRQLLNDPCLT